MFLHIIQLILILQFTFAKFYTPSLTSKRGIYPPHPYNESSEAPKTSSVTPLNYTIRIRPILEDGFPGLTKNTAQVNLSVRVKFEEASKLILLEHKGLRIGPVKLTNSNGPVEIEKQVDTVIKQKTFHYFDHAPHTPFFYTERRNNYEIHLKTPLQIGSELELEIPYEVNLTQALHHSNYRILLESKLGFDNYGTESFAVSTLEKYYSHTVLPLFVNKKVRTPFKLIIGRNEKYGSLSNTKLDFSEADSKHNGWVWDNYIATEPLLPHQIFLLVSSLSNQSLSGVNFWAPKEYLQEHSDIVSKSLEIAVKTREFYNSIFKSFPTGKLDILRLPAQSHYNADHLGIILLNGGRGSLYNETFSENQLINKIVKELARQWIGITTSIQCLHCHYETQLEENLVTYLSYVGISNLVPAEIEDFFENDHGLNIIQMLEEILTRPVMLTAVVNLISQRKWSLAYEDEFYSALDKSIVSHNASHLLPLPDLPSKAILPDWLSYKPEIIVQAKLTNKTLEFNQQGYDSWRRNNSNITSTRYWTPITFQTNKGETNKLWLSKNVSKDEIFQGKSLDLDGDSWILLNPKGLAPYTTLYDLNLTLALASQLETDHLIFSVASRVRIMFDHMTLASRNFIPIENALELTKYLQKEKSSKVWREVDNFLYKISENTKDDSGARREFQKYFVPRLQTLFENVKIDSAHHTLQRICVYFAVPTCVKFVTEKISQLKQNPELTLVSAFNSPPLPSSEFLCLAVSQSNDATTWDFLLDRFLNSGSLENYYLIEGLTCTKNFSLVDDLLQKSLTLSNEGIQKEIYKSFAQSRELESKKLLYSFLKTNVVSGKITPEMFSEIMTHLYFSSRLTPNMDVDLREFITSNKVLLKNVLSTLEMAEENFNPCEGCGWWEKTGNNALIWVSNQNKN